MKKIAEMTASQVVIVLTRAVAAPVISRTALALYDKRRLAWAVFEAASDAPYSAGKSSSFIDSILVRDLMDEAFLVILIHLLRINNQISVASPA